ncbi:DUF808 domain-containing protein [Serinibacter salmoneus]|uniref:Inner membrane protein YedI n=1 Tax=Serinibacter salmoneus TaxID=556530 RepID=A0A2A9D136_9MICO|nr:DUF808 domain-containing protein [Serinibacter salmoneus]PFG19975.1 hypothetical protein ATL40_1555 [Serinibacter salmoneus]
MAGGLAALLDDVAAIAKIAAASVDDIGAAAGRASAKAVGVVVDDAAVTPRFVHGAKPNRELPIIRKIAIGSIRNKLLIILPAALLLSEFLPWLLTPILMLGGTYLAYEGAEKIWERLAHHETTHRPAVEQGPEAEKVMISGAIRTDLVLSAEIMVISLNEVAAETFWMRAVVLVVVAFAITALVYGVVALIVKMDDVGLRLAQRENQAVARLGVGLVRAMPAVLAALATVGIAAMLWVGGHILLVGADELGWHAPYELVHHTEEWVLHATGALGGFLGWLTNTIGSAIAGVVVGAVVVAVVTGIGRLRHGPGHTPQASAGSAGSADPPEEPSPSNGS